MRRRMGAAALEMDAASDGSWQPGGALPSRLGFPVSTGRNERCSSRRSMRIPVNRSCSTATAESTWWTPSPPARAGGAGLPHRRRPIHRRRLPTQRECRPGSRIRAGAGAVTIRRQITDAAGVGHASCSAGRRTTRRRQQGRNDLPGQQLRAHVRRQCDGSVAASARRSSWLRPRQSPCRAAHRILALTPALRPTRLACRAPDTPGPTAAGGPLSGVGVLRRRPPWPRASSSGGARRGGSCDHGGGSGIGAALCRASPHPGARLASWRTQTWQRRALADALPVPAVGLEVDVTVAACSSRSWSRGR